MIFVYAGIDFEYTFCFDLLKIKTQVQLRVATTIEVKKNEAEGKTSHVLLKGTVA